MTVSQARKLLGKDALLISDEDIQQDIEVAEMLKNLFFDNMINSSASSTAS
jgi:hypothetical protein